MTLLTTIAPANPDNQEYAAIAGGVFIARKFVDEFSKIAAKNLLTNL